jgi:hypothetical protein
MSNAAAPFIRAAELWLPEGPRLRCGGGVYGTLGALAEVSAHTLFDASDGLPGRAYAHQKAELLLPGSADGVWAEAVRAAGVEAIVAFPILRADGCVAVLLFYCGSGDGRGGCAELWEPDGQRELRLVGGHYGALAPFERVSRRTRFPAGRGLPGLTWERGAPQLVRDVRSSAVFVRLEAAREASVKAGLCVPLYRDGALAQVVMLLAAGDSPLARALEVWTPDPSGALLLAQAAYDDSCADLMARRKRTSYAPGEGAIGRAFADATPLALQAEGAEPAADARLLSAELAAEIGIHGGLCIPVFGPRRELSVLTLLL